MPRAGTTTDGRAGRLIPRPPNLYGYSNTKMVRDLGIVDEYMGARLLDKMKHFAGQNMGSSRRPLYEEEPDKFECVMADALKQFPEFRRFEAEWPLRWYMQRNAYNRAYKACHGTVGSIKSDEPAEGNFIAQDKTAVNESTPLIPRPHKSWSQINLRKALGTEHDQQKHENLLRSMRDEARNYLDFKKDISQQDAFHWNRYVHRMCELHPIFLRYQNQWPIMVYATHILRRQLRPVKKEGNVGILEGLQPTSRSGVGSVSAKQADPVTETTTGMATRQSRRVEPTRRSDAVESTHAGSSSLSARTNSSPTSDGSQAHEPASQKEESKPSADPVPPSPPSGKSPETVSKFLQGLRLDCARLVPVFERLGVQDNNSLYNFAHLSRRNEILTNMVLYGSLNVCEHEKLKEGLDGLAL